MHKIIVLISICSHYAMSLNFFAKMNPLMKGLWLRNIPTHCWLNMC